MPFYNDLTGMINTYIFMSEAPIGEAQKFTGPCHFLGRYGVRMGSLGLGMGRSGLGMGNSGLGMGSLADQG